AASARRRRKSWCLLGRGEKANGPGRVRIDLGSSAAALPSTRRPSRFTNRVMKRPGGPREGPRGQAKSDRPPSLGRWSRNRHERRSERNSNSSPPFRGVVRGNTGKIPPLKRKGKHFSIC